MTSTALLLLLLLVRIGKVAFVAVDALEAARKVGIAKLAAFRFLHPFEVHGLFDQSSYDELNTFILKKETRRYKNCIQE